MRIPDPKANTTTEAYLAYKAGYLEESELKPVLYNPDWHFDGWLAYWAGLTGTYPTKENGDPEMLCDEEALVAYLSGVTDTYPEEIKDPYDVRIVGYLRHLASIRWPEPDYSVNNEEFYLSTMEPTHTSNLVPSSDIELDTAEGKIISVEAYGDTYQQTYDGKNLFNKSIEPIVIGGGNNTVTETATGVRITVNTAGTYSFRGWIVGKVSDYLNNTLTLSANVSKSANGVRPNMYIGYCDAVGGTRKSVAAVAGVGEKSCSAQITEVDADGREYIIVVLYGTEGREASIGDYSEYDDVQLQIGEETSYEPYTGGIPAPNPDYPQNIEVVTGEQTVTIGDGISSQSYEIDLTGKNLFDKDNANILLSYFDSSTTIITADSRNRTIFIPCLSNTTYTVSKIASPSPRSIGYTEVIPTNGVQVYGIANIGRDETTGTITTGANAKYLVVRLWSSSQDTSTTLEQMLGSVQIELGPTATPYAPYYNYELCKIGNYQDYIYKSGDDWYVHKGISKTVLNGSEAWTEHSQIHNNIHGFRLDIGTVASDGAGVLADRFRAVSWSSYQTEGADGRTYGTITTLSTSGPYIYLSQPNASISNLSDFKNWLSTHNTTVYYALATPTDTKITDATLVGQLEALAGADTYDEKTYIKVTATEPNLPALLKVEAYKY